MNNYAPMARAIVKSYNNYDRTDTSEPFLRMFDPWEGHCNAGGLSGSTGENQESSSEAVQSWTGMFLLGSVLNDQQMVAAGAMGFAMESAATNEYWQDIAGTNRPSTYTKGIAGQVWGGHTSYTTFFLGRPRLGLRHPVRSGEPLSELLDPLPDHPADRGQMEHHVERA